MKHVISMQDVCEGGIQNNEKDSGKEIFLDYTDFDYSNMHEILIKKYPINKGGLDVTILDLFNIPFKNDSEIIKFIKDRTLNKIDIETSKGISEFNNIFNKSIELFEKRYLRTLPPHYKKLNFKNTLSIINFIKETKTSKTKGIVNCSILKIAYCVDDVINNEKFQRHNFIVKQFLEKHIYNGNFQKLEHYEDEYGNIITNGTVVLNGRNIKFKLILRQKSSESITGKQISNPKYFNIDEMKDVVGGSFYLDNQEDLLYLMRYVSTVIFKGKYDIENKNGIDNKKYEEIINLPDGNFKNNLIEKLKETSSGKKIYSGDDYREIKLIGYTQIPKEEGSVGFDIGTELKFIIAGQDNEKGISFHVIYDYLKRFSELTRLGLPIRKFNIITLVNDFFTNIDKNLKQYNKNKNDFYIELYNDLTEKGFVNTSEKLTKNEINNEKILGLGLYKYFVSKLMKVKETGGKKHFYFDKRALDLKEIGLQKESLKNIE